MLLYSQVWLSLDKCGWVWLTGRHRNEGPRDRKTLGPVE